jgi:hypothetical protein
MAGPKVTLDTNAVINLFDSSSPTATSIEELTALIRHGLSGKAEISITTRVEADIMQDKEPDRRAEMLRMINAMPVIGSIFPTDMSRLDHADTLTDISSGLVGAEIQAILFPGLSTTDKRYSNKRNDIDHLTAHYINKRDIFVTDDRQILRKRDALADSVGIQIKRPGECLQYIDEIVERTAPRTLSSPTLNPAYQARAVRGRVTFDYSNNNGNFAVGDGHFLFETRWLKASDIAIHVNNYASTISGMALAKSATNLEDVRDAASLDYSSDHRTPKIGQIVVWRNVNGLYAATKVIGIKDDSRADERDEITFDYVILANGGTDFGA